MFGQFEAVNNDFLIAEIGLNHQMLPVFIGLLFAAAVAWLYLSKRLYDLLREDYPVIYQALGRPKSIVSGDMSINFRVFGFLLRRSYEITDDDQLIRLGHGLRSILIIYIICLIGSLLLLLNMYQ